MIEHLSFSSVSTYLQCGRAWKYRYQDGLQEPRSAGLVFGSAAHGAIRQHTENGNSLVDAWGQAWGKQIESGDIDWGKDTPEALYNYGVTMFTNKDVVETISSLEPTPIQGTRAIEHKITLQVPGVPVPVIGFIDMIVNPFLPVDFKTSSRSWTQKKAEKELQATFYLAALNQQGLVSLPADFKYIVLVKNKTPKVQEFTVTKTADDIWWLFNMIGDVWRSMRGQIFLANGITSSWKCDYCGFFSQCKGE